jgi:hypothetical protein
MFKKLWYEFEFWLTGTSLYHFYMVKLGPIMRLTTDYSRPDNKRFHQWGSLERKGYVFIQPGDMIFAVDNKKVVAKIIGNATKDLGKVKPLFVPSHAALFINKDRTSGFEIAEMTMRGFTRSTWEDVTREATRIVIGRCIDFDDAYIEDILIPKVMTFTEKKYDERFIMGEDTLACSELNYFADVERRLQADIEPLIGKNPYITPVGLLLAPNLKIIWDSDAEIN